MPIVWSHGYTSKPDIWFADSAAMVHVSPNWEDFTSYQKYDKCWIIKMFGYNTVKAVGVGNIVANIKFWDKITRIQLTQFMHVPGTDQKILSLIRPERVWNLHCQRTHLYHESGQNLHRRIIRWRIVWNQNEDHTTARQQTQEEAEEVGGVEGQPYKSTTQLRKSVKISPSWIPHVMHLWTTSLGHAHAMRSWWETLTKKYSNCTNPSKWLIWLPHQMRIPPSNSYIYKLTWIDSGSESWTFRPCLKLRRITLWMYWKRETEPIWASELFGSYTGWGCSPENPRFTSLPGSIREASHRTSDCACSWEESVLSCIGKRETEYDSHQM